MISYKKIGFYVLALTLIFLIIGLLLIGISNFKVDNGLPPGSVDSVYESINGFTVLSQYYNINDVLHSSSMFFNPQGLAVLKSGIIFAVVLTPIAAVITLGLLFSGYYWER